MVQMFGIVERWERRVDGIEIQLDRVEAKLDVIMQRLSASTPKKQEKSKKPAYRKKK